MTPAVIRINSTYLVPQAADTIVAEKLYGLTYRRRDHPDKSENYTAGKYIFF